MSQDLIPTCVLQIKELKGSPHDPTAGPGLRGEEDQSLRPPFPEAVTSWSLLAFLPGFLNLRGLGSSWDNTLPGT